MAHYDLIVIGAGSGNMIVDQRFADRRVAIVERDTYGGTCLNRGCIPSKMLVLTADAAEQADDGARWDLSTSFDGVDWAGVQERVFGRTDQIARDGLAYREGQENVDTYDGTARFTGERRLAVELAGGEVVELTGDQVVIAAGSRPVVPDVPGLADVDPHTSDTIMRLDALPRRLAVIGGGYVGCELAHVFEALGAEVTIVEAADTLLDAQDDDVSARFTALMSQRCDVRLGTSLARAEREGGDTVLHLDGPGGGELRVDTVLVAAGRRPNTDLLDVDTAGVDTDDAGRVVVDASQRTTAEGVWALGDVSTEHPLKHVANREARVVQHNLLHPDALRETDHRFVPQAVFASPQVAAVGLTEAAAREQGVDLAVGSFDYAGTAWGWALADDEAGYFCKVLGDRATGRLVGAHLVGPQAATLVHPLVQAMALGQGVREVVETPYWIHPAPTEVVENALLALLEDLDGKDAE